MQHPRRENASTTPQQKPGISHAIPFFCFLINFRYCPLSLLLSSRMGEMVEHIRVCESDHSKHPDFDRFTGCVKQEKNVHSNQTGLKERQMLSTHTHTHTHTHTRVRTLVLCCYCGDDCSACAHTHTHTHIYIYSCIYMNV